MMILERLLDTKDSEFLRAPLIGIGMKNHFGFLSVFCLLLIMLAIVFREIISDTCCSEINGNILL